MLRGTPPPLLLELELEIRAAVGSRELLPTCRVPLLLAGGVTTVVLMLVLPLPEGEEGSCRAAARGCSRAGGRGRGGGGGSTSSRELQALCCGERGSEEAAGQSSLAVCCSLVPHREERTGVRGA